MQTYQVVILLLVVVAVVAVGWAVMHFRKRAAERTATEHGQISGRTDT